MMRPLLAGVGVAIGAWALVGVVRHYSMRQGVLDRPSPRSSHRTPIPRGAGAGFLAASIVGFLLLTADAVSWAVLPALTAVTAVAVVGWFDDRYSVPVASRAAVHIAAGLLLAPVALGGEDGVVAALVLLGCVLATVAAINVVNFMDGIDGLIGIQALVFGVHLTVVGGGESAAFGVGLTLAAGALGFLVWNFPSARIFLGDVGSGGLAVFALFGGLAAWRQGEWPFIAIFLPLLPMFLDAAVTIIRRAGRREQLTTPHRSHLYQRLANDREWGHASVSLLYGGAAALGSVLAVLVPEEARFGAFVAYSIGVFVLGWAFDRAAPFPQPQ